MNDLHVLFFPNGNTAVFTEGSQTPELQHSWLLIFAEWLKSQGHDPTTFVFEMPNGWRVKIFKTPNGYNWTDADENARAV